MYFGACLIGETIRWHFVSATFRNGNSIIAWYRQDILKEANVANRSAVSTIKGYFYQFDYSILSILDLVQDEGRVDIECIEDIDVHSATESTAIQCKYYEKSEYNHSVIKPAIMFMLTHYAEGLATGKPSITYALKGHFSSGQDKLTVPFDLQFLKDNFLTYTAKGIEHQKHVELGVSDNVLKSFLEVLIVDINARKLDDQFTAIVNNLRAQFTCSPFAAEYFYYNNALRIIKELSIKSERSERTITKQDFLKSIDTSTILFDEWFVARRGKVKYYSELRAQYFTSLNLSAAEKLFIVHINPALYSREKIKSLIRLISQKYSKISKREPKPRSPYVLLMGAEESEFVILKQELHNEEFRFVDGYDFKGSDFDSVSISRNAEHQRGPDIRIFNTLDNAQHTFGSFKRAREIFEFYWENPVGDFADKAIKHLKLQVLDYEDVSSII